MESGQRENNAGERRRFLAKVLGLLAGTTLFGGAAKALAQIGKKTTDSSSGKKSVSGFNTGAALGEICLFAGNFAPSGWAFCDGQLLPITSYSALFNLIGTIYGGDGQITFALPDLRGRVPLHAGSGAGPGLSTYSLGQVGGEEKHQLSTNEMPSHNHSAAADNGSGTSATPVGNLPAINNEGIQHYGSTSNSTMSTAAIENTGGGASHNNLQPYLGINYIIALTGVFPT